MRKKPMKRLLAMVLAVVCVVGLTSTACAIDQPPVNSATSACVMDVDSGRILYSKNENAERCIASITKIMTATSIRSSPPPRPPPPRTARPCTCWRGTS